MKKFLLTRISLLTIASLLFFASCNKDLPDAIPIPPPALQVKTINNFLTSDANYSFFNAAVIKAGFTSLLADSTGTTSYTVFAPDNNAFIASGFPSVAVVNTLTQAQAAGIVGYLIIPGREYALADIPTDFPNIQLPSLITIGFLPGTAVPFRLTNFPSRRSTGFWFNATPVIAFDMRFRNGVVHTLSTIVTPPSLLAAQIIFSDPQLSLFAALIARGDQVQPNPASKIDSILKNPGASATIFAPTNNAVKAFINAASGGQVPLAAPDAVFLGFIANSLPAASAQGIVVYHFLARLSAPNFYSPHRAFSVNFSGTSSFYTTLINNGFPAHPGVNVQALFNANGLTVSSLRVTGVGNGGVAAVSAPPNFDKNGVNGVVHIIDRLLLPQ